MNLQEAINKRRAFRSLIPATINKELIDELAGAASLAPSCYNNQPWRFVFVYKKKKKKKIKKAQTKPKE